MRARRTLWSSFRPRIPPISPPPLTRNQTKKALRPSKAKAQERGSAPSASAFRSQARLKGPVAPAGHTACREESGKARGQAEVEPAAALEEAALQAWGGH